MVRQYGIDDNKRRQVIKEQRRKSVLWRRTRLLRIFLWVLVPIVFFLLVNLCKEGSHPPHMTEAEILSLAYLTAGSLTLLGLGIPILITYLVIDSKNVAHLRKKDESLVLFKNKIMDVYSPFYKDNTRVSFGPHAGQLFYVEEIEIFFDEIERIERSDYHQMVVIYAPIHFTCYSDYSARQVKKKGTLTGNKGFRMFYDYYTDFEEFVSEVARCSGKQILVTDKETKYKREAKIA